MKRVIAFLLTLLLILSLAACTGKTEQKSEPAAQEQTSVAAAEESAAEAAETEAPQVEPEEPQAAIEETEGDGADLDG